MVFVAKRVIVLADYERKVVISSASLPLTRLVRLDDDAAVRLTLSSYKN